MKTRKQLIKEIENIPELFFIEDGILKLSLGKIIDLVELNLKKLKS